ncbi:MAG: hypothetical protein FGM33_08750 [Candidatus Kapabacteria bacterium]|nr:hypothetical protein [Candidatus Kapabacteria bacterium]
MKRLLSAMQMESEVRSRHDLLYAAARGSSLQSDAIRSQWKELEKACEKSLAHRREPWLKISLARILITALQATGQYEKMLVELKSCPLPRVEANLYTAVTSLELGLLGNAIKHAHAARDEYKPGSSNWLVCTDVAIRGHLLSGNADSSLLLAAEIRRHPRLAERNTELESWIAMLEAYCNSFRQLTLQQPPRRGRPTHTYLRLRAQLRDASTTRQVYISLNIWQLIDTKAQQDHPLYEQTLQNLLRYVRRRSNLRDRDRLGVFVEFIFTHRYTPPSANEMATFKRQLKALGSTYSRGEVISYEILGRVLTG